MNEFILVKYNLTPREKEVVFLITKGMRNKNIGKVLYISETTVKKHIYNIFNKLSINSRFELITMLIEEHSYPFDVAS